MSITRRYCSESSDRYWSGLIFHIIITGVYEPLCLSICSVFLKSNHVINLESMWTSSFAWFLELGYSWLASLCYNQSYCHCSCPLLCVEFRSWRDVSTTYIHTGDGSFTASIFCDPPFPCCCIQINNGCLQNFSDCGVFSHCHIYWDARLEAYICGRNDIWE